MQQSKKKKRPKNWPPTHYTLDGVKRPITGTEPPPEELEPYPAPDGLPF